MNYTMMTDFYEFTMAQTYFNENEKDKKVYFDIFYRQNSFNGGYAKSNPYETIFLVDIYDTLKSGIPNAIKVALDYLIPKGYQFRIDSGDLSYLTKELKRLKEELISKSREPVKVKVK